MLVYHTKAYYKLLLKEEKRKKEKYFVLKNRTSTKALGKKHDVYNKKLSDHWKLFCFNDKIQKEC